MKKVKKRILTLMLAFAMFVMEPGILVRTIAADLPQTYKNTDSITAGGSEEAGGIMENSQEEVPSQRSSTLTDESVAEVNIAGSISYVDTDGLIEIFSKQYDNVVEIKLLADVNVEEQILVDGGRTYELDLNGKTIRTADSSLFAILDGGSLSVRDSGTNGCIDVTDPNGHVYVGTNGRFKCSSGTILTKLNIFGGDVEITGSASVLQERDCDTGGRAITFWFGKLVISENVRVYGRHIGISMGGSSGPATLIISGNPNISGGLSGLTESYMKSPLFASISGGTFSGSIDAISFMRNIQLGENRVLSQLLANFGTDNKPHYAFYKSDVPIGDVAYTYSTGPGTVTVRECTHRYSSYGIPKRGTTTHWRICSACGDEDWEDCSYEWMRYENLYLGCCICDTLRITLHHETDCVYNGREHRPQVSIIMDGTLLEPENYTVSYENNTNAGTAVVKIEGLNGLQFSCNAEFEIAPALLAAAGADTEDREYDGTDKVKVNAVSLTGIIDGDDAAAATDGLTGTIAGSGAGSYDTVTLPGNMKLTGADAGNYVLPESAQTIAASTAIHKATAAAGSGVLKAAAGQTRTYQFDLEQLCPRLPQGQALGASPVTYILKDVSLSEDYYDGGAEIDGTSLSLPVHVPGNAAEGEIGTVKITIQTENFEDMEALITVHAFKESSGNGSSGSGSAWSGSVWPAAAESAMPFLKDSPFQKGWPAIRQAAEKAAEGSTLAVDMNGTAIVPNSLFTVLQKRDVTVTFDMGRGFVWSVNGRDAAARSTGSTNFYIKEVSNAVPAKTADAAADGYACTQLLLTREGAFDFPALLTIQTKKINWKSSNAGSVSGNNGAAEYAGMYANLFYYNKEEKSLEFADSEKIAEDGNVCLTFSRGPVSMVILSPQPMGSTGQQEPDSVEIPGSGTAADSIAASDSGTAADGTATSDGIGTHAKIKSVKLSKTVFTYNGRAKKPSVTVIDADGRRIASKYYIVSYKNNKKAGTAAAFITFKGSYQSKGTVKRSFTIRPAGTSIQQTAASSGILTVKWKKDPQADGCQIQYSADAGLPNKAAHSAFVKKSNVTQKTIRALKPAENYYVRIRTYKTIKAGGISRNIYSAWSSPVCTRVL